VPTEQGRLRVAWLTNYAAPYRIPVWEALGEDVDLAVYLLATEKQFARGGHNRGTEWIAPDAVSFSVESVPTFAVSRGEAVHYFARRGLLRRIADADVLVVGGWDSPAYLEAARAARRRGTPVVAFYESIGASHQYTSGLVARVRASFFESADAVVTPGAAASASVRRITQAPPPIFEGFNAVDVVRIHERATAARPRGHDGNLQGHRFLYVGQLISRKNLECLIDAFRAIAEEEDTLTIVGEGALAPKLAALAGPRVTLREPVANTDIAEVLADHHTLVLPSLQEVWGLVVNEALAAGLHTVVSTRCGVAASVAGMRGVWLTEPDPAALAHALRASRTAWRGAIAAPEILSRTPRAFAHTFLEAVRAAHSGPVPRAQRTKILHVATLASPDGAYGGPLRVALNQCKGLAASGNEVTLVAGSRGYESPPDEIDGVPVRLFPARQLVPGTGFAGLSSRPMRRWLRKHAAEYDVIHVHFARDLVTVPAARIGLRAGVAVFLQTHGMVDPTDKILGKIVDALWVRKILRTASRIFTLSPREFDDLVAVGADPLDIAELRNGVPAVEGVTKAQRSDVPEFIFLGRLHARKRPDVFARAIMDVATRVPIRGAIVGPDEGEASVVEALAHKSLGTVTCEPAVAPELVLSRLARADVFVLPSVREPYPMAALEALSVGTPVIVASDCGIAPHIERTGAGRVFDGTIESLAAAIEHFATDPEALKRASAAALAASREEFSMQFVVDTLEVAYSGAGTPSTRAVIIQSYIPNYRVPFFTALSHYLAERDCRLVVIAGLPPTGQAQRGDAATNFPGLALRKVRRLTVAGKTISWTSTRGVLSGADVVVAPAEIGSLDAWRALVSKRSPVLLWGHIGSYVTESTRLGDFLDSRMLRKAAGVLAYTPTGADTAVDMGADARHVVAVMNTVDTAAVHAASTAGAPERDRWRRELTLGTGPVLAYVGGLDSAKKIDFLSSALDALWELDARVQIVVAGEGRDARRLDESVRRGQCVRIGYADDEMKAKVLAIADAIVCPGRVGLIAVDALAAGVPIFTTHLARHAPEYEYLREGAEVFTVAADPQSFAAAVHQYVEGEHGRNESAVPTMSAMVASFGDLVLSSAKRGATSARSRRGR
jgi:glycosyltransferase involved in cell wall biosynthesis